MGKGVAYGDLLSPGTGCPVGFNYCIELYQILEMIDTL